MSLFEKRDAILSPDRKYRYTLSRIWDRTKPKVMFIGLNPSTADENTDDRTIVRCRNFATSWGYGGLYMLNLFAYRTKKPSILKQAHLSTDIVGDKNDFYLSVIAKSCDKVIFAWGTHGGFLGRDVMVKAMFPDAYCLAITAEGHPSHPLMLTKDLKPVLFEQ